MFPLSSTVVASLVRLPTGRLLASSILSRTSTRTILSLAPKQQQQQCHRSPSLLLKYKSPPHQHQNIRRLYYEPRVGRMVYDPYMISFLVAASVYFVYRTIYAEVFVDRRLLLKDKDGKPVAINKKLMQELYNIMDESRIWQNYKTMDLAQFVHSRTLEPFVHSSFTVRFGAYFGIPLCFNYDPNNAESETELARFMDHFGLDAAALAEKQTDDGQSVLKKLKNNLTLSPEARRYLVESLLQTATTPTDPVFNFIATVLGPSAGYNFALQFRGGKLVPAYVLGGYALSFILIYGMQKLSGCFGSWAVFNTGDIDDTEREQLHKGAREYLQKLIALQEIVAKYSTNADQRSGDGSWLDTFRAYTAESRLKDVDKFAKKGSSLMDIL